MFKKEPDHWLHEYVSVPEYKNENYEKLLTKPFFKKIKEDRKSKTEKKRVKDMELE